MSPESPYPIPVSGDDPQYRHSVSLNNVLYKTTISRGSAAPGTASAYAVSGAGASTVIYVGASSYPSYPNRSSVPVRSLR
jgi:hypothetical protein